MSGEEKVRLVSLAEAKNILKKASKERKELIYEQKIALEHAQKFATLSIKDTHELIKELQTLKNIEETHAYKIADLLPKNADDVKAIFAKERFTPNEGEVKNILGIVKKYSIEE
ncbi:MAG: RNA polymerase Rpb4 family protein [Methanobacteriota archaeon]